MSPSLIVFVKGPNVSRSLPIRSCRYRRRCPQRNCRRQWSSISKSDVDMVGAVRHLSRVNCRSCPLDGSEHLLLGGVDPRRKSKNSMLDKDKCNSGADSPRAIFSLNCALTEVAGLTAVAPFAGDTERTDGAVASEVRLRRENNVDP